MKVELKDKERIDDLQRNGYQIIQNPEKFCFVRVRQSMLPDHVRRITGNTVKRSSLEYPVCFLDVSCHDVNAVLQIVQRHTASRHICALLLDLQAGEMGAVVFCFHQKRDDPGACPQIQ